MRRVLYSLVPLLRFYASNCYAQLSEDEIREAARIAAKFEKDYWVHKNELQNDLEKAKKFKATGASVLLLRRTAGPRYLKFIMKQLKYLY